MILQSSLTMKNMQMFFYFSKNVEILFKAWKVTSIGGLVGSVVAVFAFSVLYECVKSYFAYKLISSGEEYKEAQPFIGESRRVLVPKKTISQRIKFAVWHITTLVLGYSVMLMAMTCNGWIFITVVIGCAFGYFIAMSLLQSFIGKDYSESTESLLSFHQTPTRPRTKPQTV